MIYTIKDLFPIVPVDCEGTYRSFCRGLYTACRSVRYVQCYFGDWDSIKSALDIVETWENGMSLFFKTEEDYQNFRNWREAEPYREKMEISTPPDWINEQILNESKWVFIQCPSIALIRRIEASDLVILEPVQ